VKYILIIFSLLYPINVAFGGIIPDEPSDAFKITISLTNQDISNGWTVYIGKSGLTAITTNGLGFSGYAECITDLPNSEVKTFWELTKEAFSTLSFNPNKSFGDNIKVTLDVHGNDISLHKNVPDLNIDSDPLVKLIKLCQKHISMIPEDSWKRKEDMEIPTVKEQQKFTISILPIYSYKFSQRYKTNNYWDDGKVIEPDIGKKILTLIQDCRVWEPKKDSDMITSGVLGPHYWPPGYTSALQVELSVEPKFSVAITFCRDLGLFNYESTYYKIPSESRDQLAELLSKLHGNERNPPF